MTDSFIFKIVIATLTLPAIIGYFYWLKTRSAKLRLSTNDQSIRLIGSLNLGMKERIVVVECAQRHLVLALNGNQIIMLANLELKDANQGSLTDHNLKSHCSVADFERQHN